MNKAEFQPVIKAILSVIVVAGATALAFFLAHDPQDNRSLWLTTNSTGIVWMLCAILVFLTVVFFLRITRVSWFWSVNGGAVAIVLYSIFVNFVIDLLIAFISALIWG